MTTDTFFAGTSDDYVYCGSAVYSTAVTGAGTFTGPLNDGQLDAGQRLFLGTYYVSQFFVDFDTSSIADTDVVSAATLSLWGNADNSTTDFTVEAYIYDFGTSVTSADFRTPTQIGSLTRVATFATSGFSTSGYNVFTSDAAFISNINLTGSTRLVLVSSRDTSQTAPTGDEYVYFKSAETSGTSNDPKLVVVHAPASSGMFQVF